jgi:hypothetical protein
MSERVSVRASGHDLSCQSIIPEAIDTHHPELSGIHPHLASPD